MKIDLSIIVAGKICSGKSSIIKALNDHYSISIVSFGQMVKIKAQDLGIDSSREAFQKLGFEYFNALGARDLLNLAIETSKITNTQTVIFDGVRHESILREIKNISNKSILVFLDVDETERYNRYCNRISSGGYIPLEKFRNIDNHPIEQGTQYLSNYTNIIIDASKPRTLVYQEVADILSAAGVQTLY